MFQRITSLFSSLNFQSVESVSESKVESNDEKVNNNEGKVVENSKPIEHVNKNRIILMLDESGSMKAQRKVAIDAVNSFISKQKEDNPGDVCLFDLITFNDDWKRIVTNTRIEDVKQIELDSYKPNGGTALYDSIWQVIEKHNKEVEIMLVIMTDGCDTSSSHHTQAELKTKLMSLNAEKDWQIIWLGADITVTREGWNSGASAASSVNFDQLPQYLSSTLSENVSAYRKNKSMKIKL